MQTLTTKATYETIEEIVNPPIFELKNQFWEEIRNPYVQEMSMVLQNCQQILQTGFNSDPMEEVEFMEVFENDVRKYTADYIKKLFRDINVNLLRRFNKEFKEEANGSERNWVTMEESAIRDLWAKCKGDTEKLYEFFKYIEIPIDISSRVSTTPGETPGADP